jgi:hypothetical protein
MKTRFHLPVAHTNYYVTTNKRKPNCDGELVQGYCNYGARRISVHRNPNPDTLRSALWHEYFHALMHELGRPQLADDEAFVADLAQAVMRVRTELPEL